MASIPWRRPTHAKSAWDLTALLNAADPRAPQAERHVWLVRLLEWLRHAPAQPSEAGDSPTGTPKPLLKLRHFLGVLDRHPEHHAHVVGLLRAFRSEVSVVALLADFGFAPRSALLSELAERVRLRFMPQTPATNDLAELFGLLFTQDSDADWLDQIDDGTLERIARLFTQAAPEPGAPGSSAPFFQALIFLAAQISAVGGSNIVRRRISPELLAEQPFRLLLSSSERLCAAAEMRDLTALWREAEQMRTHLVACQRAARSVRGHLQEYGISVDVLFAVDQLLARVARMETLLGLTLVADGSPEQHRQVVQLVASLVRVAAQRRSVRALLSRQYSMLAREITERSAETGEHYITRNRDEWLEMLRKALGGGAVIAVTTFVKFLVLALGMTAFWSGFWAGVNYAGSFVVIHLLHWTVATKQPAMTAPAMAAKLAEVTDDASVEGFVDEAVHMIRSQTAGIVGNLAMVAPIVVAVQALAWVLFGDPLVGHATADHVLHDLTLWGPTLLFAAFTGVLLFASSLIAGWAENWFVLHRLDSAIRWNPRILARLGTARADSWSRFWRTNISGIAGNVSLGFMLGLAPAICSFFGLPLEVRHVTLSTGQLAAALGALGTEALRLPAFWWCVAAIPLTGALNLGVSFWLALKVAMRSRNLRLTDRSRITAALRRRLRTHFMSFLLPPRDAAGGAG
jgi:site-specific recombinase